MIVDVRVNILYFLTGKNPFPKTFDTIIRHDNLMIIMGKDGDLAKLNR